MRGFKRQFGVFNDNLLNSFGFDFWQFIFGFRTDGCIIGLHWSWLTGFCASFTDTAEKGHFWWSGLLEAAQTIANVEGPRCPPTPGNGCTMTSYHTASGWLRQTAKTGAAHLRQGRPIAQGSVHWVHTYPRRLWNQSQTCRHEQVMYPPTPPHRHTHAHRPLFTLLRNMVKTTHAGTQVHTP